MAKFCSLPFLSSHISTNKLFAIPITPSESRLISLNKRNPCFQFSCSSSGSSSVAGSHPSSSMIVFIKGLPSSTSEGSLKKSFSQFGEVSRAKIVSNKKTKQSLGSAFILFTSEESAQQAVREIGWKVF